MEDPKLTPREANVLEHVLEGRESKDIGRVLGISEQAVKDHVSALLQKFRVTNRAGLAEAASRLRFSGSLAVDRAWLPQFFQGAALRISVMRGPEFRYAIVNEEFRRSVGDRPVIGRRMREAFPEIEGQGMFERVERVYQTGIPVIVSEAAVNWDRGTGVAEPRRVTVVLQPLRDADGAVNGVVAFAIDVTDVDTDAASA